ncbi:fructokinase [Roseibium aquae]|uniref:Fructokinase n=1 Tax=Roseibium aquae TaxID=1323746 RepID=A0A916WWP9_9HYPH|nr:carbohydrate kinase [Roseibium aquae]GGB36436.1 fructokinase [Roseibium aquae]
MILVCGEALFDLFSDDPDAPSLNFRAQIGGSPFNVAVGLARLGQASAFFGGISTDMLGHRLFDRLTAEGVDTRFVIRSDRTTTLSLVQKDAGGHPAYTFYGEASADRMVSDTDLPPPTVDTSVIHIGSYTVLVEPVATALKTLVRRERSRCLISFDPNIRPTVVGDMARWRKNTEDLVHMSDLIKVSDEDLASIHPAQDPERIAKRWIKAGAGLVVVTRGAAGAFASTSRYDLDLPGHAVEVADTVGAGDTFQAALLMGLTEAGVTSRPALDNVDSATLTGILETSIRAAAITCSRAGADLPRRSDLAAVGTSAE